MTITLGWWLAPLLITVTSIPLSIFYPYRNNAFGIITGFAFTAALLISLVAWLIYFAVN